MQTRDITFGAHGAPAIQRSEDAVDARAALQPPEHAADAAPATQPAEDAVDAAPALQLDEDAVDAASAQQPSEDTGDAIRALLAQRAVARGLAAAIDDAGIEAAIERLLDDEVRTPEPTEEECARYYAVHPEEFTSGDLVFARHILFAVTSGAPISLIRGKAEEVLHELRHEPARFAEVAERSSNCPSGKQGGNLGQLGRGDSVPEFERALFEGGALGVLPRLVQTRYGFHIVAIDQRIPGQLVPFDLVRERIATRLQAAVQEKALVQYVRVVAGEAGVALPGIEVAISPLVQ